MWTRRAFCFSAAAAFAGGPKRGFWEAREPASWTAEEKLMLVSESPWAQVGIAAFDPSKKRAKVGYGNDGRMLSSSNTLPSVKPGAQPGGDRSVPIGEEIPPVPNPHPGEPVKFPVLARWETAGPVRLANPVNLPVDPAAEPVYIVSLRGIPLMPPPKPRKGVVEEAPVDPNAHILQAIRKNSRLDRKNGAKPSIPCSRLFSGPGGSASREIFVVFPRPVDDPITESDRIVTFESFFDPYSLTVKFQLKDMKFKGALTL